MSDEQRDPTPLREGEPGPVVTGGHDRPTGADLPDPTVADDDRGPIMEDDRVADPTVAGDRGPVDDDRGRFADPTVAGDRGPVDDDRGRFADPTVGAGDRGPVDDDRGRFADPTVAGDRDPVDDDRGRLADPTVGAGDRDPVDDDRGRFADPTVAGDRDPVDDDRGRLADPTVGAGDRDRLDDDRGRLADPSGADPSDDDRRAVGEAPAMVGAEDSLGEKALVDSGAAQEYRGRWSDIQAGFVDEPRAAVAEAHGLVAEVVQQVVDGFSRERDSLEAAWSSGDDVSTEELRLALRRYRTFFDRLLTT